MNQEETNTGATMTIRNGYANGYVGGDIDDEESSDIRKRATKKKCPFSSASTKVNEIKK